MHQGWGSPETSRSPMPTVAKAGVSRAYQGHLVLRSFPCAAHACQESGKLSAGASSIPILARCLQRAVTCCRIPHARRPRLEERGRLRLRPMSRRPVRRAGTSQRQRALAFYTGRSAFLPLKALLATQKGANFFYVGQGSTPTEGAFVPGGWYGYLVKLCRQPRQPTTESTTSTTSTTVSN